LNIYESDRALAEYLLFHYGEDADVLPPGTGPVEALRYPVRCVEECFTLTGLPEKCRALDLGCAVGRSSFELARHFTEVIGIDLSQSFIAAAHHLRTTGEITYLRRDEGECCTQLTARIPREIDRQRVQFEGGDAETLRHGLGAFDAVLLANLIDRLRHPRSCVERLAALVKAGGELVIASPYTWLEEFTPRENWLGGFLRDGDCVRTRASLESLLLPAFELVAVKNLSLLIREHARKFQWSVAEATVWRRRES